MHVDDIFEIHVRAANGALVSLRSLATVENVLGPGYIYRFNNLRAVAIQGGPAPGYSSGQALAAMERVSQATLPPGFGFSWSLRTSVAIGLSASKGALPVSNS